jgi:hypothetical protein
MKSTGPPNEEPQTERYERFVHLLTEIVAVPKAAVYSLDPALDPSLRPKEKTAQPAAEPTNTCQSDSDEPLDATH